MSLTMRVVPGPNNKKIFEALTDKRAIELAFARANTEFAVFLKQRLVRMTHQKVRKRTGTLAKRWRAIPTPEKITVTNDARSKVGGTPYAVFLERGTRPHFVAPRRASVLVFRLGGRGPISSFKAISATSRKNFGFSRGHKVRGIKPRRIFRSAFDPIKDNLGKLNFKHVRQALLP